MTVKDLLTSGIEIQAEIHICYYDEVNNNTIQLTELESWNREIVYMYVNYGELWIEVEY